jgi:hypothetical protein
MSPEYSAMRALPLHDKLVSICSAVLQDEPQSLALGVLVSVVWQIGQTLSDEERAFLSNYLHMAGDIVARPYETSATASNVH